MLFRSAGAVSLLTISSCVARVTSAPFTVRILSPTCICPFLAAAPLGVIFEMYIDWENSDTFKCTGTVVRGHGTNKYISFEIDNNERAKFSAVCGFIPLGIGILNNCVTSYAYNTIVSITCSFIILHHIYIMYNVVYEKHPSICCL